MSQLLCPVSNENKIVVRKEEEKISISSSVVKLSEKEATEYTRFIVPKEYVSTEALLETNRKFLERT